MKQEAFLIAIAISLISATGAVVNEDGTSPSNNVDDGEMAITSASGGSSASASTAVNENGTEWSVQISMTDSQCLTNSSAGTSNSSFESGNESYSVSFQGTVETANPCHTLEHEVIETSHGHYMLNITSNAQNGTCTTCVGGISYEASFESDGPFDLEVLHNGDKVEGLTHPEFSPEGTNSEEKGVVRSFFDWLNNLF